MPAAVRFLVAIAVLLSLGSFAVPAASAGSDLDLEQAAYVDYDTGDGFILTVLVADSEPDARRMAEGYDEERLEDALSIEIEDDDAVGRAMLAEWDCDYGHVYIGTTEGVFGGTVGTMIVNASKGDLVLQAWLIGNGITEREITSILDTFMADGDLDGRYASRWSLIED